MHCGRRIPPDADFFQPPPPEIGPILTAYTSLRAGRQPFPWWAIGLFIGLPIAILITMAICWENLRYELSPERLLVGAAIVGVLVSLIGRYDPTCSYVGEEGIARYRLKRGRGSPMKAEVLLFQHAAELRTSMTHQYTHGIYYSTSFAFTWSDISGVKQLELSGQYRDTNAPKPGSLYNLGRAAEIAWSRWLLDKAQATLDQYGFLQFNLSGGKWVRVGPGFLEFSFGGEPERCDLADIAILSLNGGVFAIRRKDARWFSRQGKYDFPYGTLANARVFVLALEKLLGYRFG